MKRLINKKIETIFIVILLFTFILGFLLGFTTADKPLKKIELKLESSQLDLKSAYESFLFQNNFAKSTCDDIFLNSLSNKIYKSGILLEKLEKEKKIDSQNYRFLKIKHNINQVLLYTQFKKFKDKCNDSKNVILFFFNSSKTSMEQGKELDKLNQKIKKSTIISMDYNYTSNLDYFYKFYNVTKLPTLIINFNKTLNGLVLEKNIKKYIK